MQVTHAEVVTEFAELFAVKHLNEEQHRRLPAIVQDARVAAGGYRRRRHQRGNAAHVDKGGDRRFALGTGACLCQQRVDGLTEPVGEFGRLQLAVNHCIDRAIEVVDHEQALKAKILEQARPQVFTPIGPIRIDLDVQVFVGVAPGRVILEGLAQGLFQRLRGFLGVKRVFQLFVAVQVVGQVNQ